MWSALVISAAIIVLGFLEGCTLEVDVPPIEVEEISVGVEVTATLSCNQYSLAQYLDSTVCEYYNPEECCNLMWDDNGCWISFCDECIGLTQECYEDD